MGISAHYYAYLQDDIEMIKNGGGGELLDEYDLNNLWDAMCKMLTGRNFQERLKAGDIFSSNTYPDIFGRQSEFEDIKASLKEHFTGLLNFYQNAASKGLGVLIVKA